MTSTTLISSSFLKSDFMPISVGQVGVFFGEMLGSTSIKYGSYQNLSYPLKQTETQVHYVFPLSHNFWFANLFLWGILDVLRFIYFTLWTGSISLHPNIMEQKYWLGYLSFLLVSCTCTGNLGAADQLCFWGVSLLGCSWYYKAKCKKVKQLNKMPPSLPATSNVRPCSYLISEMWMHKSLWLSYQLLV